MTTNNTINVLDEAFKKRTKKSRVSFRRAVCDECEWGNDTAFYRKRKGLSQLTKLEIAAIKRIDKKLID